MSVFSLKQGEPDVNAVHRDAPISDRPCSPGKQCCAAEINHPEIAFSTGFCGRTGNWSSFSYVV
jgi:hypothetical protein